jgi:hypothetical protein
MFLNICLNLGGQIKKTDAPWQEQRHTFDFLKNLINRVSFNEKGTFPSLEVQSIFCF